MKRNKILHHPSPLSCPSYFRNEETEAKAVRGLLRVTQCVNSRAWGLAQKVGAKDPVAVVKTQSHLRFGYSLAMASNEVMNEGSDISVLDYSLQ